MIVIIITQQNDTIMELFKIIKKVFDLTRNEIQQVLKDSKAHAKDLVEKEAVRADTYSDNQLTAANNYTDTKVSVISSSLNVVNNELARKLNIYTNFRPFSDVCNAAKMDFDGDPDYIIWEIFRRIYTSGFVGKAGINGVRYYTATNEEVTFDKCAFFNTEKLPTRVQVQDNKAPHSIYNIDIPEETTSLEGFFELLTGSAFNSGDSLLKYISSSSINSDTPAISCRRMFYNCQQLMFIDFDYPKNALDYSNTFKSCSKLRHKSNTVNLPNATNTSRMFEGNKFFGIESQYTSRYADNDTILPVLVSIPSSENADCMFNVCENIVSVSSFYAPVAKSTYETFRKCISIKTVDEIDISVATDARYMFYNCQSLIEIGKVTHSADVEMSCYEMFKNCQLLKNAPVIDGVLNINGMFYGCVSLISIPLYKVSDKHNLAEAFIECESLTDVGGFVGLCYTIYLGHSPHLTRESCLNIFNNAATITDLKYVTLHSEAYARLTEEDIAIAVNKGWAVAAAVQSA